MLRLKNSMSRLDEITESGFQTVIDEADDIVRRDIARVILCSGKVYYDLMETRKHMQADNVAILRIEQLYPFPREALQALLRRILVPKRSYGAKRNLEIKAPGTRSDT